MIDVRVLGPLDVRCDDHSIPIRSRRQRAILVRLIMEPGHVVAADALIDSAWGDDVPMEPTAALQNQISRLRSYLGPLRKYLLTRPPGYVFTIPPESVDSNVFEQQVARARAIAAEDATAALQQLDAALALWRGPAFAEFADSIARPEAVRLEQLRVASLEQRIELLIETGELSAAVGLAESLNALEPLREHPYAQRMKALVLTGRASESLSVYQELRDRLAQELGTEPADEVRELHLAILRQEVAPFSQRISSVPQSDGKLQPPPTFPSPISTFVGRDQETSHVLSALERNRVVSLIGPGGVGKTRLAIEIGTKVHHLTPYFVELASLKDSSLVANAFLNSLRISDSSPDSPVQALVTILRHRELLLVVDNCEQVVRGVAEVIEKITQSCAGVRFLTTSRERLGVNGEYVINMPPLDTTTNSADGVRLFADRLASSGLPLSDEDSNAWDLARRISFKLDGLPLALEIAAASAATLGLETVDDAADILGMGSGQRTAVARHKDLRALLQWSYQLLSPAEKTLLRRLSVFPSWFSIPHAIEICADDSLAREEIPSVLASLVDKSLISRRPNPRMGNKSHSLLFTVSQFAHEKLVESGEQGVIYRAYALTVLDIARKVSAQIGNGDGQEIALMVSYMSDLRSAHEWARQHDLNILVQLSAALSNYAIQRWEYEILGWAEEALSESRAKLPVAIYRAATIAAVAKGDLRLVHERIEAGLKAASTDEERIPLLTTAAHCAIVQGQREKVPSMATRTWELAREAGDILNETINAGMCAVAYERAGLAEESRLWMQRCRETARHSPSPICKAYASFFAGEVAVPTDAERAVHELERSHDTAASVGADFVAGIALTSLVTLKSRARLTVEDVNLYDKALRFWRDRGNRSTLWLTIRNLVPLLVECGRHEYALKLYTAMIGSASAKVIVDTEGTFLGPTVETASRELGKQAKGIQIAWSDVDDEVAFNLATQAIRELQKDSGELGEFPDPGAFEMSSVCRLVVWGGGGETNARH